MTQFIKLAKNIFWEKPIALFALLILSFGLMIPWLGYGFDEWHFIYYSTRGHIGLAELFHYDGHPQATWAFTQSINLLGYNPFYWHIYSLIWRLFAVFSFWLCLESVWKNHSRQNFLVAAFFAIHPIFTLQVFPISFFEIWLGFTLLFLSFYFTVQAIQTPERLHVYWGIAFLLNVGHIFTREYAWFVELMRPLLIWFVLNPKEELKQRMYQTVKYWFPFFFVFLCALIWRGFFYTPLRKFFQVEKDIFANPISTLFIWITNLIPDILIVMVTSWYETLLPNYLYFARPFNIAIFVVVILVVVLGVFFVRRIDNGLPNTNWSVQAIIVALPSILLGILPFYIASYFLHLTDPPHNTRLAIGMLPGAALISVATLEAVLVNRRLRIIASTVLLGLAVSWHVRYTNDFRKVWEYQSDFLKQLTWRVPGMEKNTALFVYQPTLPSIDHPNADIMRMGDFALSMAINSIYQVNPVPTESQLSYWYYGGEDKFVDFSWGIDLYEIHATTVFEGNTLDSLLFYYEPKSNRCLHLLTQQDQFYKQYPEALREISPHVSVSRVLSHVEQDVNLRDQIFGEAEKEWCFFYQKADLARQFEQWDEIVLLWADVEKYDLRSDFGTEYIPFVEGFAYVGDWHKAEELTLKANRISKAMGSILCPIWSDIDVSTPSSNEKLEALQKVNEALKCTNP